MNGLVKKKIQTSLIESDFNFKEPMILLENKTDYINFKLESLIIMLIQFDNNTMSVIVIS